MALVHSFVCRGRLGLYAHLEFLINLEARAGFPCGLHLRLDFNCGCYVAVLLTPKLAFNVDYTSGWTPSDVVLLITLKLDFNVDYAFAWTPT